MKAADLFCGAGGTSTGLARAARSRGVDIDLVAVNHWQRAVDTHARNHPWARHVCADLASVEANPAHLVPGRKLDLLAASPECTHHSVARGGRPCSDQSRASAWHVLHWCEILDVADVLVENVREFEDWGPLLTRAITFRGRRVRAGRPDPRHKGATFQAFVSALRSFGYAVEWRVINAADYGAATTRRRLFLRASKRKAAITWPEPTHTETGARRWRPAREIIDWSLKGESVFNRKTPLRPKTMARIEAGLRKFGGEAFVTVLRGSSPAHTGAWSKSVDEPLGTVTAGGNHLGLCQPFVVNVAHAGGDRVSSCDAPLGTIPAGHRGEFGVVQPFVIPMEHGGRAAIRDTETPLPTITTAKGGAFGLCQPFVTKYYGTGGAKAVTVPLDTVTTRDRYALVEPCGLDIRFRMLQPHELAAAMGFDNYEFTGTKTDQVKQIGNAVAVPAAEALCGAIIDSVINQSRG